MESACISLRKTNRFSKTFLDYIDGQLHSKNYYDNPPSVEAFESQIKKKKFPVEKREILYEVLKKQYEGINTTNITKENLLLLKEPTTFTITTGHQLNIFTGPLYFIYKIVTAIKSCRILKEKYPQHHFVPVYWMASEDHDLDEINHFNLLGETHRWETDQKGAVGRMHTKGLTEIHDQLKQQHSFFAKAYQEKNLATAVRSYVNDFFGDTGLIVIDADDRRLKQMAVPLFEEDLFKQTHEKLVKKQTQLIESNGDKAQVFPRPINLFYLERNLRARLEKDGDQYTVVDQKRSFSKDEISNLLKNTPEVFSPNVVLRPVYQEIILPNLAYIGGPSELVYWFQLKPIFEYYDIPFPILLPRNFGMILPHTTIQKLEKWSLTMEDFFLPFRDLKQKVFDHIGATIPSFEKEEKTIVTVYEQLKTLAGTIDTTLIEWVGAEEHKALKNLKQIEKRLKQTEESKHEETKVQLNALYNAHFPSDGLQERHANLLEFLRYDPTLIQQLIAHFDPFDFKMHLLKI